MKTQPHELEGREALAVRFGADLYDLFYGDHAVPDRAVTWQDIEHLRKHGYLIYVDQRHYRPHDEPELTVLGPME